MPQHREWFLLSPTEDAYVLLAPGRSLRFVATVPHALTVWRDAQGQWHTALAPNPDRLIGADRVYPGGRVARLSDEARAELVAAGFSVSLMEV